MAKKESNISMEEAMLLYKKIGAPGAPHNLLARLEGSWTTRTRSWMEPGKDAVESSGTCEQKMVLDGRFLQQSYVGDMMGERFLGVNIMGYNNQTGKYESVWIDSMSTAIFFFEGSADADGRSITQSCKYDDPVKGPSEWRSVTHIKNDNILEFEMFLTPEGGTEEKVMEMTVTRKAAEARKAA